MAADATKLPRGVKFEVRPGKTVLTNGDPRQALMPLTLGTTDQTTFTQVASLNSMVQMGTGSADIGTADRATAGGMSMAQSASIKRQKRTLMNFQNTFLIPMINKALHRKIQFDVERYPVVDVRFIPYSTMGIMAKELEMQQMVSLMQTIPQDSPAFNAILTALLQNSTLHNRDQLVAQITQGSQPNPEQQQMQMMQLQVAQQTAQAEINKLVSEAAENNARALKYQTEAQKNAPNDLDIQEKIIKLQKEAASIEKMRVDMENTQSETMRNIPEVEHLRSETALNLANAREKAVKTILDTQIQ